MDKEFIHAMTNEELLSEAKERLEVFCDRQTGQERPQYSHIIFQIDMTLKHIHKMKELLRSTGIEDNDS